MLDGISASFTDHERFAKVQFARVDGTTFEVFADWLTIKALSDKFLAYAANMKARIDGENAMDLRPLSELDESDADDVPEMPENLPRGALESFPVDHEAIVEAMLQSDPAIVGDEHKVHEGDPGFREPGSEMVEAVDVLERDTKDFLEMFGEKPDDFFALPLNQIVVRNAIELADAEHPEVKRIAALVGSPS